MSIQKSYNRLALQGLDFDDMDFVETFNLDPKVAYTPQINFEMLNHVYDKSVRNFMSKGMTEATAKREAGRLRAEAKAEIQKLLK